jgi:hypothetical protein
MRQLQTHIRRVRDAVESEHKKKDATKRGGVRKYTPREVGSVLDAKHLPTIPGGVPAWAVDDTWLEQHPDAKEHLAPSDPTTLQGEDGQSQSTHLY